ncbi:MAG: amidohydrolase, partial [Chloroflexi bacterium]|nr:amidohydrolase [Chloroflexota bacterium]
MSEPLSVYLNGTFLTMDPAMPRAEALLVRGDRIAALGRRDEVEPLADASTRRIDLEGGTVLPGFDDCHCHILSFGLTLDQVDVGPDVAGDIQDIRRAIARRAEGASEGEWIIGRGYDQNALAERRYPTRMDLDDVSRGHPVVLWHTSGHALTCNSRALELAAIGSDTPTPPGGDIERDEHGAPTGVLKEAPATDRLANVIPPPTIAQGTEAILRAMEAMAGQGITSASDAATGQRAAISDTLTMYRNGLDAGRLKGRITLMPQILYVAPPDSEEAHPPEELRVGERPEWLRVGPAKIFADGALTTRTAALRRPYEDVGSNTGLLIWEPETLAGMIRRAHLAGWQIATHAIGDRAVEVVVGCYERAVEAAPRADHRHRLEHCMLLDDGLARRIKRLGVVAAIQPGFMARLGDAYIAALGRERASQLMPMGLFRRLGIPVGFSSDRPVIPGAPLAGVRAAVTRTTPGGDLLGPEHALGPLDAIRYYTAGSAYATHFEHDKGVL